MIIYVKRKMKYIICIPTGGFNDMLVIINRCFNYAVKYKRLLIIDTTKFGWFIHDIRDYILFTHEYIYIGDIQNIYLKLVGLTYMPSDTSNIILENRFDINKISNIYLLNDYKEDVIISRSGYGSNDPNLQMKILNYMIFKTKILDIFNYRYSQIPANYTSFHVRNTDIKSPNVDTFIKSHIDKISGRCFIASDDINVIKNFKTINNDIFCFSNIPELSANQNNIHYKHKDQKNKEQFIIDCIVDILLLASAKLYYFSSKKSGYSRLANTLFNNKQLLNKLLNINKPEMEKNIRTEVKLKNKGKLKNKSPLNSKAKLMKNLNIHHLPSKII